MSTVRRGN
ncbi:unnamed protein product [Acanthoscelides obtectus]|uniref:Uncharacterized protein n=1 Tax=Acanthoscelides obtectus TaxID=200917 RepID=A0A9P0LIF4_ACAOB|nr:unnamed protein product [Acanthoscelides obtectus]CAK1632945.1 hypothetical protein AOBTE_LOCUS7840 [Acanthoscelides obtectus]